MRTERAAVRHDLTLIPINQFSVPRFDFDHPPPLPLSADRMPQSFKKLASMTPLQILCSFQTWNAAPIAIKQHKALAEVVDSILNRGADPNSVAAKNTVAGSVAGMDL